MKDCCGCCAHHYEGSDRRQVDGEGNEYFVGAGEFGGHGSHPNGKCIAPGGRYRGVVIGFHGHCDKFKWRGDRPPEPAPAEQMEIDPFVTA